MDTTTAIETLAMEHTGVSEERLRTATTLEEAGIDSLAAIDLVFAIEAHFGVLIGEDELTRVQSLSDLVAAVDGLVTGGERAHGA